MATYGYARVSTVEQNEGRQLATLYSKYNILPENMYVDKCSGKNTDRPKLQELLDTMEAGDTIVVSELSRLGRSTRDLLELTDRFIASSVKIIFDKEQIDSSTSNGRLMLTVFAAFAEFERALILERQREGIALAKSQGRYHGRKPIELDPELVDSVMSKYLARKITQVKARELLSYKDKHGNEKQLSVPTFYNFFNKYLDDNNIERCEFRQKEINNDEAE